MSVPASRRPRLGTSSARLFLKPSSECCPCVETWTQTSRSGRRSRKPERLMKRPSTTSRSNRLGVVVGSHPGGRRRTTTTDHRRGSPGVRARIRERPTALTLLLNQKLMTTTASQGGTHAALMIIKKRAKAFPRKSSRRGERRDSAHDVVRAHIMPYTVQEKSTKALSLQPVLKLKRPLLPYPPPRRARNQQLLHRLQQ